MTVLGAEFTESRIQDTETRSFYITTPIYYVNDKPHIGHAYSTIIADVLRRYHRLFGEQTFLLTGTDEHGQKVADAARARSLEPQQHVDEMVKNFTKAWEELGIDYDIFMRTTFTFHKDVVGLALQKLFTQGDIYKKEYEGWYSISEEIFYPEKDVIDGKSPSGKPLVRIKETNYFFRMSAYQERLIEYLNQNRGWIYPETRANEVLGFLKQPLGDLCISRPKARLDWGIPLPFDTDFVTYVWFDALLNYVSAIGYMQSNRTKDFSRWWSRVVHLIGKDILIPHAVYWPTMLMALGISLPERIIAHGWWLTSGGGKMSKSEGKVVDPLSMKEVFGVDALRYFLVRGMRLGQDALFDEQEAINRINADLANNLGNLLSRTSGLITKHFEGTIPSVRATLGAASEELAGFAKKTVALVLEQIENYSPDLAMETIMALVTKANQYMNEMAPWKAISSDRDKAAETLWCSLEVMRLAGLLLSPVMPTKMAELMNRLNANLSFSVDSLMWGQLASGSILRVGEPLFPKIEHVETETLA
jgi:methionyl-tRNA synthetase